MDQPFYFDNRRRSQGNNGQSPYNSPNYQNPGNGGGDFRGFHRRGGYRNSLPQQSPYRQQYSPHAFRGSRGNFRGRNNQHFQDKREIPISKYFHPSMLEDPWAILLEKSRKAAEDDRDLEVEEDHPEVQGTDLQSESSGEAVQNTENLLENPENPKISEE